MINLETKIQYLKGVGPKMGAKLNKLGIETAGDLLYFYPRRYEDYTKIAKIGDLQNPNFKSQISNLAYRQAGKIQNSNSQFVYSQDSYIRSSSDTAIQQFNNFTIRAQIVGIGNKTTRKRGFTVTEAVVEDGTGSLKVVWFNQPYLAKMLKAGYEVILNGKVSYNFFTHDLTMESPNRANRPKIVPIYSETEGLSSHFVTKLISNLKPQILNLEEFLPIKIIEENKLLGILEAITNIHQPKDSATLERARERIAFDELFTISLRAQLSKVEVEAKKAPKIEVEEKLLKEFVSKLPFELTADQKVSAWKIISDIKRPRPMNRLLNGDVGSGKTVVAAFAAYVAIKAGFRVAFMAPTEILANQHYRTCRELLSKFDISVGLITSSQSVCSLQSRLLGVPSGSADGRRPTADVKRFSADCQLVIGTHALLQDKITLQNIGLVIVDEQHRFGVKQRQKLADLSFEKCYPHFLSMTATPIPRTLYLALFADLDLSVIKTMPKGRKEIKTRVVDEANRGKAYQFIRQQIESGRQAFVVCPLIELKTNNEKLITGEAELSDNKLKAQDLFEQERKSVMAEYSKLSKQIFPDLKIGMLHGKMKSAEKEAIMGDFKAKKIDILVSTSVVEVGVDIPNASLMIIEDAERFGLASLHQFRGRVGRAEHQSFCFLFSSTQSPLALSRLRAMEQTNDGFKLAELDLSNRGAGDIFGIMQSGDINLKIASLSDRVVIEKANNAAQKIVADGIEKYPAIMAKVKEFEIGRHLE